MSPESYVLLLIGCWLLLASSTLWGILRITRRHYLQELETDYSDAQTDLPVQPTEQQHEPTYAGLQLFIPRLRAALVGARLLSVIAPLLILHRRITTD